MTEHGEQVCLIQWADANKYRTPELAMLYAIANAGAGAQRGQAGKMKAEGVRAGVPDLCLAVPRNGHHGLYIEMKTKTGKASQAQQDWLEALSKQGYCAKLCRSFEDARDTILRYLEGVK